MIRAHKKAGGVSMQKARLLDLSSDAILGRDASGRITFWNEGAAEIYGFSRKQAIGRVSHDLLQTEFPEPLQCIEEKLIRDGRWAGELRHRRANGSSITVSTRWVAERDAHGNITSVLESNRDISDTKQAQEAQNRLAAIVESSDDAIVSKNLDGIITSWNAGAHRIFEWSAEEAVGKSITIIIPPELRDEEKVILSRLQAGQRINHFETVRQTKTGKRLNVSLTISPIRDSSGSVVGASKIARDITERKQMEAQLKSALDEIEARVRERTAELSQKNEELTVQSEVVRELSGRLLRLQDEERRRIARELHDSAGQLLAAISMNIARVMKEKEKLSSAAQKCVEENASLVEQTSTEIRTMSHLLHPPLLDEVGLESAIRGFIEGFVQRSKIEVNLIIDPEFKRLSPELEIAIFRVVQESLTNVHRHSGSHTALVRLARKHGCAHVEVSDEGRGLPPDKQNDLNSPGTVGVGVRGMRERIRQLGGVLQIDSKGTGTTVTATLPIDHTESRKVSSNS
jgi:PAS domain S-box-containing protein